MFKTPRLFYEMLREEHTEIDESNFYGCLKHDGQIDTDILTKCRYIAELRWREHRRPYYKVYPKILSALCKVNLDLPITSISYPVDTLMVLLPEGQTELVDEEGKSLLGFLVMLLKEKNNTVFSILPYRRVTELPYFACGQISRFAKDDLSIEDALMMPMKDDPDHKTKIDSTRKWTRLAVALSLLAKDSDVIVPDILSGDVGKNKPNAEERAHQRGKIGWLVGKDIEMSPHVRIPHLCNQPYGAGSNLRKLIWRKGSVIHRDKIKSIPTGFEG